MNKINPALESAALQRAVAQAIKEKPEKTGKKEYSYGKVIETGIWFVAILEIIETVFILKVGVSITALSELHFIKVFLVIVTVFTLKCGLVRSASLAFVFYCAVLLLDIAI